MTYITQQASLIMTLKEKLFDLSVENAVQFNRDSDKQANEVIFSRKTSSNNLSHPPIKFNKIDISKSPHQKHLEIVLDSKLSFNAHVEKFKN